MFDRLLLGRLRANGHQIRSKGRARVRIEYKVIGFHGNQIAFRAAS